MCTNGDGKIDEKCLENLKSRILLLLDLIAKGFVEQDLRDSKREKSEQSEEGGNDVRGARPEFRIIKYEEEEEKTLDEIPCVAYARHPTEGQLGSCDDQLRRIRREFQLGNVRSLKFPNAKLVLAYELKDEAVSGFESQKEQFLIGRSLMRQRKAWIMVVLKMDRTSRNMVVSLEYFDFLQENEAELISIGDKFSSAQEGARIQFMEKAYHSEQFLENVSTE